MEKWLFYPEIADPEEGEEAVNFDFVTNSTAKELEQFKSVCNQLLSRTYIVRTIYQPGKGRVDNPDYLFLSRHYEAVQEYLSLLIADRFELFQFFCRCIGNKIKIHGFFSFLRICIFGIE